MIEKGTNKMNDRQNKSISLQIITHKLCIGTFISCHFGFKSHRQRLSETMLIDTLITLILGYTLIFSQTIKRMSYGFFQIPRSFQTKHKTLLE